MPKLQIKTKQEVQRDIINAVVARTSLSDVTDSSTLKHFITAVSTEVAEVYFQFTRIAELFDFRKAAGLDLDERAKEILGGTVERFEARRSVGQLEFTRAVATASPVTIPAGTIVETADGFAVETTEDGTIAAGATGSVPFVDARASEVGEVGNIGVDTAKVFRTKPAGVSTVTNPASFGQGRDRESDDSFRSRILDLIATLPRCTPEALTFIVLGVEDPAGSGKTIVFSHTFEDASAPGTAVVYVDDGTGNVADYLRRRSAAALVAPGATSLSALVGTTQTLTLAGAFPATAAERAELLGGYIAITKATNPTENNGLFPVLSVPDADTITYTNAGGIAEGAGALFAVGEPLTLGLNGPPTDSAVGGEEFLDHNDFPMVAGTDLLYLVRGNAVTLLTRDTVAGGDYDVRLSNGRTFFSGTAGPLQTGDRIISGYQYFTGVVAEAQKVIDGDIDDRLNYPGWRAAGVDVRVLPPTPQQQAVIARLTVLEGFERTTVVADAETAISDYINNLGISGDVIYHELVERVMGVDGVYDLTLKLNGTEANRTIDDHELARITALNIDVA